MVFTSPDNDFFKKKKGSRLEVFHGIAYCCGRGKKLYTRSDLVLDEQTGKIKVNPKQEPTVGKYMPSKVAIADSDEPWIAFNKKYGSRELVFNGIAYCTKSGLKKTDLMLNAKGRIVSRKKSEMAKIRFLKKKKESDEKVHIKIAKKILKDPVSNYIPKKNITFAKKLEEVKEFEEDEIIKKYEEKELESNVATQGFSPVDDENIDDLEFADAPYVSDETIRRAMPKIKYEPYESQFNELKDLGYLGDNETYQSYRAPRIRPPKVYSSRNFWRR